MDTLAKVIKISILRYFLIIKRDVIRSITKNADHHDERYIKIKFNPDDL